MGTRKQEFTVTTLMSDCSSNEQNGYENLQIQLTMPAYTSKQTPVRGSL